MPSSTFFKSAIALALTTASFGVVLWFAWGRSLAYDVCSSVEIEGVRLNTSCYDEQFSAPFQVLVTSIVSLCAAATIVSLGWLLRRRPPMPRVMPPTGDREPP